MIQHQTNCVEQCWVMFHQNVAYILAGLNISSYACSIYKFLFYKRTKSHEKLNSILMNTRILNDIRKLSSNTQTSCLEGYHATLNYWHPKMMCFSWLGIYCRYAREEYTVLKVLGRGGWLLHFFNSTICIFCISSYIFRNILASLHFNENVKREAHKKKNGEICYKVTWPKFKEEEDVVRKVSVPQSYGIFYYILIFCRK